MSYSALGILIVKQGETICSVNNE